MEVVLTVKEYAELRGITERHARRLISSGKINADSYSGKGGVSGEHYVVPLMSCSPDIIKKYNRLHKKDHPEPPGKPEKPPYLPESMEELRAKDREEVAFWTRTLKEWEDYCRSHPGGKTELTMEFVAILKAEYPDRSFTDRMLYRKKKALKELGPCALSKKVDLLSAPPYTETTITGRVLNAIKYSHLRGVVSVVYGDAGVGKTQAYRHYLEENSGQAIGITISPTYASITGVNELLAEQLGIREKGARKITRELVARLKGSGRVILVDEAQHLTQKALDHLRCLADMAGIGVCLIGNEEVYSKLRGSGKAEFAQLYSRIGMRGEVLNKYITEEDVRNVFRDAGLPGDAIKLLHQICHTGYSLRGAVNVYINTAAVFGPDGVTAGRLAQMMREMNIGR